MMESNHEKKKKQYSKLGDLPDLALLVVLSHIPYQDLLCSAQLTCKRFHQLAREQLATRRELNLIIAVDPPLNYSQPSYEAPTGRGRAGGHPIDQIKLTAHRMKSTSVFMTLPELVPRLERFRFVNANHHHKVQPCILTVDCLLMSDSPWRRTLATLELFLPIGRCGDGRRMEEAVGQLLLTLNQAPHRLPALRHLVLHWQGTLSPSGPFDEPLDLSVIGQLESIELNTRDAGRTMLAVLLQAMPSNTDDDEEDRLRHIHLHNQLTVRELMAVLATKPVDVGQEGRGIIDRFRAALTTLAIELTAKENSDRENTEQQQLQRLERSLLEVTRLPGLSTLKLHFDKCYAPMWLVSSALRHLPALACLQLDMDLGVYFEQEYRTSSHLSSKPIEDDEQQPQPSPPPPIVHPLPGVRRLVLNIVANSGKISRVLQSPGPGVQQQDVQVQALDALVAAFTAPFGAMLPSLGYCTLTWLWRDDRYGDKLSPQAKDHLIGEFRQQFTRSLPPECRADFRSV